MKDPHKVWQTLTKFDYPNFVTTGPTFRPAHGYKNYKKPFYFFLFYHPLTEPMATPCTMCLERMR